MDESTSVRAPRIILISGVAGVGKSTLAKQVAINLEFDRIVSTDSIREVLRTASNPSENPALHRSTFSHGSTGDANTDWLDACAAVELGVEAVISRARREGIDIIVEGAHVIPSNRILNEWREQGGVAVGINLAIDNESVHQDRIIKREAHSHRGSSRYLAAFSRIRTIQTGLITKAKGADWKLIDTHLNSDNIERIRQWLDEEWYKQG
ncbi:MAG: AAA family ATPase [Candidatus Poseidoniaceae archaeon]|nr:AAA family ATPase [Candidatus Poseidoniaceae archaeon]HJL60272.1 AAA family ATPase [Candidatus Thalassarchaeaceae archaeon]